MDARLWMWSRIAFLKGKDWVMEHWALITRLASAFREFVAPRYRPELYYIRLRSVTRSASASISAIETGRPAAFGCSAMRLNAAFSARVSHLGIGGMPDICGLEAGEVVAINRKSLFRPKY